MRIRPSNVLLCESGSGFPVAKVADFGISKLVAEDGTTRHSTLAFTAGYAAPEVLWRTLGSARSNVDVYSFGVLMGAVLTQSRPVAPDPLTQRPDTAPARHSDAALRGCGASEGVLRLHGECVSVDADDRPVFGSIVRRLTEEVCLLALSESPPPSSASPSSS